MTRTLWVTSDLPPRAGGIEQFLGNLLRRLDPASTRVLAASWPGDTEHDAAAGYRVDRIGRRPLLPTRTLAAEIRRAAEAHRAEVVVFGAAWPLGTLGRVVDVPTLALTHGHEAGMARVGLGPLIGRVARSVDALSVISRYTAEAVGPHVRGKTRVVELAPGVDTTAFHPEVAGEHIRDRHDVPRDAPLAVCVSRLVARKGQDVLVEAWPAVVARLPAARLLIAGDGPREDRLQRRVRALGLDNAVTLAGPVAWLDLPGYHAAGDVFAMPCRTRMGGFDVEGLGIVYLEAQACGRPVVAGRSGGAPEAIVDGETGLVVDGRDPAAVATAVADLLADPARRATMGVAGRAFVEANYAWPVIVARLQHLLADLASGPRGI